MKNRTRVPTRRSLSAAPAAWATAAGTMLLTVLLVVLVAPPLAAVNNAADTTTAEPEAHGFSSERLDRITARMQRYVDAQQIPGAVTLVARHGEVVHFEAVGSRHVSEKLPMEKDTIVRLYSQSKPITGAAVLMLYEEGHFLLSDPISKYLPEFKTMRVRTGGAGDAMETEAARAITIHHLLTHTSGLSYNFFPNPIGIEYQKRGIGGTRMDSKFENLETWSQALAEVPLIAQPGTAWNYSVGMDVLGRLVEVISGQTFGDFLKERIFDPLGMVDTGFHVPADKINRFAANYVPKPDKTIMQFEVPSTSPYITESNLDMGGSGLVGTAADYLRFAQMLVNDGELDGVRLLAPSTVEMMTANHLPPSMGESPLSSLQGGFPGVGTGGVGFGLTGSVTIDPALTGVATSKGIFGWGGAATTHFWVDREKDIVGIVLTQLLPDGTQPIRESMLQMTYQALVE